jgi:hypothetical protein
MTSRVAIKHGLKDNLSETTFHFGMWQKMPARDQNGNDWVRIIMLLNQLSNLLQYFLVKVI